MIVKTRTKNPPAKIKKSELPELLVSIANELDKSSLDIASGPSGEILKKALASLKKHATSELIARKLSVLGSDKTLKI